eukprot:TRINITY_DN213_c0_g2_i3.p1 TRINITY_DN213_c0_g2~~TRINITY_DN213_c0_g2_i3.p1  ORF type:complete len:160 (+),score=33.78 TRINITY_DN213_c0_g2_i3:2-481(+)
MNRVLCAFVFASLVAIAAAGCGSSQLTEHFSLSEMIYSDTAIANGLSNNPSAAIKNNLCIVAQKMEIVRTLLGNNPITVNSGYRSPAVNSAVGGASTSQHMQGQAMDFVCPEYGTPRQITDLLQQNVDSLDYDQLLLESTWVHVSFKASGNRNEFLDLS